MRLLTAHRSKGGEWDVVVVADVQEGVWPDLRRRGSLLEADRLSTRGPLEVPTARLLAEVRDRNGDLVGAEYVERARDPRVTMVV